MNITQMVFDAEVIFRNWMELSYRQLHDALFTHIVAWMGHKSQVDDYKMSPVDGYAFMKNLRLDKYGDVFSLTFVSGRKVTLEKMPVYNHHALGKSETWYDMMLKGDYLVGIVYHEHEDSQNLGGITFGDFQIVNTREIDVYMYRDRVGVRSYMDSIWENALSLPDAVQAAYGYDELSRMEDYGDDGYDPRYDDVDDLEKEAYEKEVSFPKKVSTKETRKLAWWSKSDVMPHMNFYRYEGNGTSMDVLNADGSVDSVTLVPNETIGINDPGTPGLVCRADKLTEYDDRWVRIEMEYCDPVNWKPVTYEDYLRYIGVEDVELPF